MSLYSAVRDHLTRPLFTLRVELVANLLGFFLGVLYAVLRHL